MAKVLVVDDSFFMRDNLKKIITAAGHEVVGEGTDGVEAFDKYVKLKPDVVTLDITMPNENGLDALKKIIDYDPKARVIMVTSIGIRNKILEALTSGAKNYIIKPFDKNKVAQVINDSLAES
jgi:two-component system chemotaxis response regulator CheY